MEGTGKKKKKDQRGVKLDLKLETKSSFLPSCITSPPIITAKQVYRYINCFSENGPFKFY